MKTLFTAAVLAVALSPVAFGEFVFISDNAGADGFTGWTEANFNPDPAVNGRFLGASGTGMDTSNLSWGLYANSGGIAGNTYTFGSTLPVEGYVEIDLSLGLIGSFGGNPGAVGFNLQNSAGVNRFQAFFKSGDNAFSLSDAGGEELVSGGPTFAESSWTSSNYQTVRFTLGPSNTYTLSFNGTDVSNTGLTIAASDIDRIRIFNFTAGATDPDNNQYFNNLVAVPEPSTLGLLALGSAALGVGCFARRGRRHR